jgi:hypothetical protein
MLDNSSREGTLSHRPCVSLVVAMIWRALRYMVTIHQMKPSTNAIALRRLGEAVVT